MGLTLPHTSGPRPSRKSPGHSWLRSPRKHQQTLEQTRVWQQQQKPWEREQDHSWQGKEKGLQPLVIIQGLHLAGESKRHSFQLYPSTWGPKAAGPAKDGSS